MNDVFEVAKYIVHYCNSNNIDITNLKLQKLLYFIQAEFLITFNEPCFDEEIIALPYGPAVGEVLKEYSKYGATKLKENQSIYDLENIDTITEVLDEIASINVSQLIEITRSQSPWRDAYNEKIGNIIEKQVIKEYFYIDLETLQKTKEDDTLELGGYYEI